MYPPLSIAKSGIASFSLPLSKVKKTEFDQYVGFINCFLVFKRLFKPKWSKWS
ncbi:hypothetical protein ETAE_3036 [Edwardsiella piscicida]|uniref:Uncharacterized protein n=1 Tax=Edwardsiella piscicida TaxID=1263550 RepID=A0AAU8P5Y6_EDWPI|nr:hypothetical protein ETAE_3036 [Edwardsiella tarda EIB202]